MKLSLTIEVDQLLVTCKTVDRLMLIMWAYFLGDVKHLDYKKALKIKHCNLCTKVDFCRKYQGKTSYFDLKLSQN